MKDRVTPSLGPQINDCGTFFGNAGSGPIHAAGFVEHPGHRSVLVIGQAAMLAGIHDQ